MDTVTIAPAAEPIDFARIEAEAHRLRAEAMREGLSWVWARLSALWSHPRAGQPRSA